MKWQSNGTNDIDNKAKSVPRYKMDSLPVNLYISILDVM